MNVAIIGGGFTGLAAAYELTKHGHKVTLFEAGPVLGGLAYGFKGKHWDWHLEYAYHHWFTNDFSILNLIKELGLEKKLIIRRPITANLIPHTFLSSSGLTRGSALSKADSRLRGNDITIAQLDSPINLFRFPGLSIVDKFRTAALLAFLKINPFWKPLENITAEQLLTSIGGKRAYQVLWEPLLVGKFGTFASTISAAWFWARIKKRTPSLAYMRGGFHTLVVALEKTITRQGGKIFTGVAIDSIKPTTSGFVINKKTFDTVLLTVPTPIATKLIQLPETYTKSLLSIPHLWAQTLILETNEPMLKDIYWLNVTDRSFPFLAAVAHTNFMDKKNYGGHHLTYLGNYLPQGHRYLSMSRDELLKEFLPFIKKLNPAFDAKKFIINSYVFVGPFAQPVHQLHYSQKIPSIATPIPGVYLANMDFVLPWDRGTNYAVELGVRAAIAIQNTT